MGDIDIINAFLRKEPFKRGNIRSNGSKLFVDDTCICQWINYNLGQRVLFNNSGYNSRITKVQGILLKTLKDSLLIYNTLDNIPFNSKDIKEYYGG